MSLPKTDLIDAIDLLNEARLMAEAAYLACGGMQLKQEASAMQAVVGAYTDRTDDALRILEAAFEMGAGE